MTLNKIFKNLIIATVNIDTITSKKESNKIMSYLEMSENNFMIILNFFIVVKSLFGRLLFC